MKKADAMAYLKTRTPQQIEDEIQRRGDIKTEWMQEYLEQVNAEIDAAKKAEEEAEARAAEARARIAALTGTKPKKSRRRSSGGGGGGRGKNWGEKIVAVLKGAADGMTTSEISDAIEYDGANLSAVVAKLAKDGTVKREESEGRGYTYYLA